MVVIDQEGRITLINASAEKLFGYYRSELLGQPVGLLAPERFRSNHPGHHDGFFANPALLSPLCAPWAQGGSLFGRARTLA